MNTQDLKKINDKRLAVAEQAVKRQDHFVQLADNIAKSLKNIDPKQFKAVTDSLTSLSKELKNLPGVIDNLNQKDNDAMLGAMEGIKAVINSKDFSPKISVKSPEAPRIDVSPIVKALDSLKEIVVKQETKDDTEETDRIVESVKSVQEAISSIRFPVPNYVLPFISSSTGKSTQARVDTDGGVSIQNDDSFKDSFPGTSLNTTTNWDVVQSDGTTGYSVANSLLSVTAGTTSGAYIAIRSKRTFKLPIRVQVICSLSQRIANNAFYIELVNAAGTTATALATTAASPGVTQAAYAFSSTTATNGTVVAQNQGVKSTADTTVTVATTANQSVYEMDCKIDSIDWQTRTTDVASASSLNATQRNRTILDEDEEYYLQLRSVNTAVPASSTTWNIESVLVEKVTKLAMDVVGARGNVSANRSLPVSIIAGTVTTVTTVTTVSTLTSITNWGNIVDNAAFTDGTTRLSMNGYIYDEVAGTALTENDAAAARINANRAQIGVIEDSTTRGRYATVTSTNALKTETQAFPTATSLVTYSARITTNATTTPTSSLCYVSSIAIATEVAGTTSTISIRDKSGTALHLVSSLTTVAQTGAPTVITFDTPIKMTGGIDIVTAGAAAATVDVWINYYQ